MKNIVFVTENSFPFYAGGIENWLYNMSIRLCQYYNIYIISENPTFYKKAFYTLPSSIKVVNYFTFRKYRFFRAVQKRYFGFWGYRLRGEKMYRTLFNLVKELKGDAIVVALGTISPASATYKVKRIFPSILFVCSARGPHAEIMSRSFSEHSSCLHKIEIDNLKRADVSLTNGDDTFEYFKNHGVETIVMKNGVDFNRFQQCSEKRVFKTTDKIILSIGTLWDVKCISELIRAFALAVKKGKKDLSLYFAGKGNPEKYKLEANNQGVGEKVFFLGHRTDIPFLAQQADIIACLSEGGGFSMAALESMASGTPVIAWDTPVYSQFNVDEERLALVPFKDIECLSEGILKILNTPEESKKMAERARMFAERFDWNNVIEDFISYVDKTH